MVQRHDGIIDVDEEWARFIVDFDLVGLHENARLLVGCYEVSIDQCCL